MPYEQTFGASPGPPAPSRSSAAAPDPVSDAAAAIAVIGRMEATIRNDRAAFVRLRGEAQAMARAIADAKAALQAWAIKPDAAPGGKAVEIGALLLDLESRLNAMQFLMDFVCDGGADAPARELDHVPTVSDIVSRLGRGGEAAAEDRNAAQPKPGADQVPSVSMLGALVEALAATVVPREPKPVAPTINMAPQATTGSLEPPPPAAMEMPLEAQQSTAGVEAARPAPSEVADTMTVPEGDLLESFARMEAVPILAPDIGSAVIFARRTEPTTATPDHETGRGDGA